jgi:hypothetical protein
MISTTILPLDLFKKKFIEKDQPFVDNLFILASVYNRRVSCCRHPWRGYNFLNERVNY